MEKCKVRNFTNAFAHLKSVGKVLVVSSEFNECGRTESGESMVAGGGVFCYEGEGESVVFDGNYVQNVYIKNINGYGAASGAFFGLKNDKSNMCLKKIEVKNNIFTGGKCITENDAYEGEEQLIYYGYRNVQGMSAKNNIVKGGSATICEEETEYKTV